MARAAEASLMETTMSPTADAAVSQVLQSRALKMVQHMNAVRGDASVARRHIFALTNGRCSFRVANPRRFRSFGSAQARLGDMALQVLQWEADTDCQTSTERLPQQHVLFHVALKGQFEVSHAGRRAQVREGQLLAVSTPGMVVRHWQGGCDLLNLVVPRASLVHCLRHDFRVDSAEDISFEPLQVLELANVPTTVAVLETIMADLAGGEGAFANSLLSTQAARMLSLLLLKSVPHKHAQSLGETRSSIAPYYVRRAEAYMRDNLQSKITMDALAAAAGVSVRTLYYGFRDYRSVTPMRHLKHMRLDLARARLASSNAACKVSDIIAQVGYPSASQFSRDYKSRFGERPLQTLMATSADL
jgi:AraC-like DNA-binding protein